MLVKSFLSRTCECWGVRTVYTASWWRGHAISSSCMIHVMTLPWNLPASFPTFCVCRDFVVGVRWLGASPTHPPPPQKVMLGGGEGGGVDKEKTWRVELLPKLSSHEYLLNLLRYVHMYIIYLYIRQSWAHVTTFATIWHRWKANTAFHIFAKIKCWKSFWTPRDIFSIFATDKTLSRCRLTQLLKLNCRMPSSSLRVYHSHCQKSSRTVLIMIIYWGGIAFF